MLSPLAYWMPLTRFAYEGIFSGPARNAGPSQHSRLKKLNRSPATRMVALTYHLNRAFQRLTVRATEFFLVSGNTATGGVSTLLGVAHRILLIEPQSVRALEEFGCENDRRCRVPSSGVLLNACSFTECAGIRKNQGKYGAARSRFRFATDMDTTSMLTNYLGRNP